MTLYIDTHLNEIDIVLFKDNKVLDRITKDNVIHTKEAVGTIKEILDNNNCLVSDIKSIIVINGPGSFTGVRIGVVIAKVMGYSLNIEVKDISFLEGVAISYDEYVNVAIEDKNGAFIGEFDNKHQLIKDYYYVDNKLWNKCDKKKYVVNKEVDVVKVYDYLKDMMGSNIHLLKPLYVKKIEVLR